MDRFLADQRALLEDVEAAVTEGTLPVAEALDRIIGT
jgi:hypothetical protein